MTTEVVYNTKVNLENGMSKTNPPIYMEKGSEGPAVDLVLEFLERWCLGNGITEHGIVVDGVYGNVAVSRMKQYQADRNISRDGGCGPKTRMEMAREDGFFFTAAAQELKKGVTEFVQPDGESLFWNPSMKAQDR